MQIKKKKSNSFDKTPQGRWDKIEDRYGWGKPEPCRSYSMTGFVGKRKATAKKRRKK